jgi:quinol monooxygenase YgiN
MTAKQVLVVCAVLSGCCCLVKTGWPVTERAHNPIVRLAELEIDPAQLDSYKAALKEEIATSIRVEPGVLKLYAVSVKDHPNQIRLFEMYKDQASYQAHLQTPHFRQYKAKTQRMVTALTLIETEPILLGSQSR